MELSQENGACSQQQTMLGQMVFWDETIQKYCVCIDGFVSSPCESVQDLPSRPLDFYNSKSLIFAPALINNNVNSSEKRHKRQAGSAGLGIFLRNLRAEDVERVKSLVGDVDFKTRFGMVATWVNVGDLVNDPSNTNTFQIILACDNSYKQSGRQRCAVVFVYLQLNYIQNTNGQYMRAGINNGNSTISFELIGLGPGMGDLLTSQGVFRYELKGEFGSVIGEYDPENFRFNGKANVAPSGIMLALSYVIEIYCLPSLRYA
ncbi:uncharacterized protein LOC142344543 [Convolutriloba macropyga]|uniref:uncharacterized protein LOC142344543 n=1 Tax=Convolutriloba macropyga TaxID=536237 RepID=UPI003F5203A1